MEYLNEISKFIDARYMIVFMAMTYALKDELTLTLGYVLKIQAPKVFPKIWTVFIIGTLTAVPFWFFFGGDKMILLISWAVGTSLHDLLIERVIRLVKKKLK